MARFTRHLAIAMIAVIAVAAGRVPLPSEERLSGLYLAGFAGLIDPLRPEAGEAVAIARRAGIRVAMITGDHPLTALAIARQIGLANGRGEIAGLQGGARDAAVGKARVFARTDPLQKLAIVESLRRQGHVVAVTGDGVNDAPALHAADIGVAMGKGGTDVAREAADLILTDDNFASIVAGIEAGRVACDNLGKVLLLLISTAAAEILLTGCWSGAKTPMRSAAAAKPARSSASRSPATRCPSAPSSPRSCCRFPLSASPAFEACCPCRRSRRGTGFCWRTSSS